MNSKNPFFLKAFILENWNTEPAKVSSFCFDCKADCCFEKHILLVLTLLISFPQTIDAVTQAKGCNRIYSANIAEHQLPLLQSYLMVLAAIDWAISLDASSSSTARVAQPTTGGGRELEKRYGRERCLRSSIKALGPTV